MADRRNHEVSWVYARPHFRRENDKLFFFLSNRVHHVLSPAQEAIWEKLSIGRVLEASIEDKFELEALVAKGIVEKIVAIPKVGRRKILVVEPHCDDAALSIGATMWKMRYQAEFHLLTMASRSNYSTAFHMKREYFNREIITRMRTAEGELFAAHVGGKYYCADLPEATLRYSDSDWSLPFFIDHEVATAVSNNRRASSFVLEAWEKYLCDFLSKYRFEEIWLPLGAGTHSDHDLARNAGLRAVPQSQSSPSVRLYEDVPYGSQFPEHTKRVLAALQDAGAVLKPSPEDISGEFERKLQLLRIFASQFKVSAIQSGVERSAGRAGNSSKLEYFWQVQRQPATIPESEIWINAPRVARVKAQLRAFARGARRAKRVAIFAISPSGRWRDDLAVLSSTFPSARFVVYAGPRVCAEFGELVDQRVAIHCVSGSLVGWLRAALRELLTSHHIIIAGDESARASALRGAWPIGRTLITAGMDELTQALTDA